MVVTERVYTNVQPVKRLYNLSECIISIMSEQSDRSSTTSPPRTVSEFHPEEHGMEWDECVWQAQQQVVAPPSAAGKDKFGAKSGMEWDEIIAAEQPPQASSISQQAAAGTAQVNKPILEVLNKRAGPAECGAPSTPATTIEESVVRDFDPFVPVEQIPAAKTEGASEESSVSDVFADKHVLANVDQADVRRGSREEKCVFCPKGKCRNGKPVTQLKTSEGHDQDEADVKQPASPHITTGSPPRRVISGADYGVIRPRKRIGMWDCYRKLYEQDAPVTLNAQLKTSEGRHKEEADVTQPASSALATDSRPRRVISAADYGVIRPRTIGMWDCYSKLYKQAAPAVTDNDAALSTAKPMPFVDGRVMALLASDSMAYKILQILNEDSKDVVLFELGPVGRH